jgi:hypothetical protein
MGLYIPRKKESFTYKTQEASIYAGCSDIGTICCKNGTNYSEKYKRIL